ncbi:MAG: DUF4249 family protein [Gemmatimonadetes bacterium]|nr:DUF4249 family protein [Gemmatimonadota bacterium]
MRQMRPHAAWVLAVVGVLAAQACTDSDPMGPDTDILVVRAFLFAGEPVADIRVTTTVPLVSEDTLGTPVSDAAVWLERDGIRFDLIATPGAEGAYHYPGSDLVIAEGEVFELGISRGSESLSATTVVPSAPEGFAVSSDVLEVVDLTAGFRGPGGFAFGGLIVRWINPERDLFFVVVDNLETDPEQIPAPEFIREARRFVSAPTPADSTTISQLSLTHLGEHRILLYHVNQEYADLYEGRVQDSRDLNEPPSNIRGGLGVFSAFASREGTFTALLTSD